MTEIVASGANAFAALVEVRAGLHAQLDALDAQRLDLQKQLRTIEASMRVVQPGVRIERRPTKWRTPEPEPDAVTQIASGTSRMLRLSRRAMTVPELVQALLEDRGVDPDNRACRSALRQAVGLYMRKQALKPQPIIRRVEGSDPKLPHWEIIPLQEIRARSD